MASNYETNVFINVPFDEPYNPLFNAIIFSILDCGFKPRCAKEEQNAAQPRIEKLCRIISGCKLGVHDISRVELDLDTNLPRFNMPFELGLFCGANVFGKKRKRCLILDRERYRYQKFISDIAGQDIHSHQNQPSQIIAVMRNWLSNHTRRGRLIPSGTEMARRYGNFQASLPEACERLKWDPQELTYNDYRQLIARWQKAQDPW